MVNFVNDSIFSMFMAVYGNSIEYKNTKNCGQVSIKMKSFHWNYNIHFNPIKVYIYVDCFR